MHDLVIKLDNLLKDRRLTIDLIDKYEAKKNSGAPTTLWERYVLFIARRTKRQIDHDVTATFNKLSLLTDGHALKSFILR